MRYIGIDYGERNIGIAISDETNTLAFPLKVIVNDVNLIRKVCDICAESNITHVVVGESKDYQNKDNKIMDKIREFSEEITQTCKIKVIFEPELLTTMQASRIQGDHSQIDASAAAIILQSYLDKR